MANFCNKCGSKLSVDDIFCSNCGNPIKNNQNNSILSQTVTQPQNTFSSHPSTSSFQTQSSSSDNTSSSQYNNGSFVMTKANLPNFFNTDNPSKEKLSQAIKTHEANLVEERNLNTYIHACELMNGDKENFKQAVKIFTSIKFYKDSSSKIEECNLVIKAFEQEEKYSKACDLISENLQDCYKAISLFQELKHFKDSESKIVECKEIISRLEAEKNLQIYDKACKLMHGEIENYKKAISEFEKLPNFKDSEDKINECKNEIKKLELEITKKNYLKACDLINGNKEDCNEALRILKSLNGFDDSSLRIGECEKRIEEFTKEEKYIEACGLFDKGLSEHKYAISVLKELDDYKDSKNKLAELTKIVEKETAEYEKARQEAEKKRLEEERLKREKTIKYACIAALIIICLIFTVVNINSLEETKKEKARIEQLAQENKEREARLVIETKEHEEKLARETREQKERLAREAKEQKERLANEAKEQEEKLARSAREQDERLARDRKDRMAQEAYEREFQNQNSKTYTNQTLFVLVKFLGRSNEIIFSKEVPLYTLTKEKINNEEKVISVQADGEIAKLLIDNLQYSLKDKYIIDKKQTLDNLEKNIQLYTASNNYNELYVKTAFEETGLDIPKEIKGQINAKSGVNLRKEPSTNSQKVGGFAYNTEVTILDTNGPKQTIENISSNWYKVTNGEVTGWCFGGFVSVSNQYVNNYNQNSVYNYSVNNNSTNKKKTGRITARSGIFVRKEPNTYSQKIGDGLAYDTKVTILDTNGPKQTIENVYSSWYKVTDGEVTGWCFGGFISIDY